MPNTSERVFAKNSKGIRRIASYTYWLLNVALIGLTDGAAIWYQLTYHPATGEGLMVLPFFIMATASLPIEAVLRARSRPVPRYLWGLVFTALRLFVALPALGVLWSHFFGVAT